MFIGGKHLLCFLLLQSLVVGVLGCSCQPLHPQKSACQSEFVLAVRLENGSMHDTEPELNIRLTALIKQVYKGNIAELDIRSHPEEGYNYGLVTLIKSSYCGSFLIIGETYLIFAKKVNRHLEPFSCSGFVRWSDTTHVIQNSLSNVYNSGCHCWKKYTMFTDTHKCYAKYAYRGGYIGSCGWIRTIELQECIRRRGKVRRSDPILHR